MRCGGCSQENPARAKFCLECGSPLSVAAPAGESRRTVTVVFADMVGFTSLGESLDQESLRRVMDTFYAEMRAAIEAQEGTLAKFIGDAVLAVWGTPVVREDDALRAVRAADAMRRALTGLNADLEQRWGVRVGMRTGVNTGEVVVDPSRPADLLVGDTLNVAARLEQAAGDGEVLVGPDTYRLVRDDVALEPVAPLALKGKSRPMAAWRVVDAQARGRAERLQAPLVGRESELAALDRALAATVEAGACRMATVIGSPGLGKTRLVSEFVRQVAGSATVLQGRCQATGEGITFQPVAEVLRGAAGIGDDDTPDTAREKLGAVLPAEDPDRERVVERVAGLLGLGPVASAEETFWAIRRILESLARDRPVVLVHDDIHWGQPTFLDMLEHFVEWIRDAPVFVLALARPELREVRPGLAEPSELTDVIALEPLDAEASRAMVSGLLGAADLPEGLARRVLETTEGNPLFLGETLRMLADEGLLERRGDTWVAGDLADVAVPPTINALLASRIERLDPQERSVVERAAVIGHSFYRGAVAEMAPDRMRQGIDGALDTLTRKEMIRPEDEWWLDEQVFRFHHVLIRDAAYRSLLKEARAELHERFAVWLEAKAGSLAGEHEEVIAFHLEQAHSYRLELGSLDEAGRALAARAGARLHSAGCRALAREDLPAAINLLRRALAPLGEEFRARLEVLVDLAEALLSAGDTGAAEEVVEELGLGADELNDDRLRARAVVFAAQLDNLTGAGQVRETAQAAVHAAETLAAAGDRAGEAKAHQVVAQAEALLGQVAAAEAALDRALVAARAAEDRRRITAVLSGAPRAALWGPAPIVRASGRCLDVVRILRMTPGNRHVEAAALRSQAVLEAMRGRADAARGILDACRSTLEELGLTLELRETDVHAGIVELLAERPDAAEEHLRAAHEGFRALGIESGAAQAAALLARALLAQGRDEDALAASRFAEEHGGEDLKTTVTWLGVRAEALARRGEHEAARELARRAVELTEPTDALADRADALVALAVVELAGGDDEAARTALGRARELYAEKDHTVGVAAADRALGTGASRPAPEVSDDPAARVALLQTTAVGRAHLAYLDAVNRRDWDALRDLFAEDYEGRDARTVGWEPIRGPEGVMAVMRSIAELSPDGQLANVRVDAMSDRVFAGVVGAAGTADGVVAEASLGFVVVLGDGDRFVRSESFDPDDRAAMLARFEELGGEPSPAARRWRHTVGVAAADRALGTGASRPAPEVSDDPAARVALLRTTAVGRAHLAFLDRFNRRDWDALRDLFAEDYEQHDARAVGWEPVRGPGGVLALTRSIAEAWPDVLLDNIRIDAMSDRVLAGVLGGGGTTDGMASEVFLGFVAALGDGDRFVRLESFDPDDRDRILARYEELQGEPSPAARRWRSYFAALERRDFEAMADTFAPDFLLVDTRQLAWEPWTRDGLVANNRSIVELDPEVEVTSETLADAGDVYAVVIEFSGETKESVPFDVSVGIIDVGGDLALYAEVWDPDDREGMLARVRQLEPLAASATSGRSPEIIYARLTRAFDARDWQAVRALLRDDLVVDDRRPMGRDPIRGGADVVRFLEATVGAAPDVRSRVTAVLARTERALALTTVHAGAAENGTAVEIVVGQIALLDDEGRCARLELWDPQDEDGMRARFAELTAGSAARDAEHARRYRDLFRPETVEQAVADVFARDLVMRDHRPVGTMGTMDYGAYLGQMRSVAAALRVREARLEILETDGPLHLSRGLVHGDADAFSLVEAETWYVSTLDDAGRVRESHMFATEEEARRYWSAVGDRALDDPEEAHRRNLAAWNRAYAERDLEAMRELLHPDFAMIDHRPNTVSPAPGREGFLGTIGDILDLTPDVRLDQELLAVEGDRRAVRAHWSGHLAGGGGTMELVFFGVTELRDGRTVRSDIYATEEDALRALRAPASHSPYFDAMTAAFNARDWDRYVTMFHPDFEWRDLRRGLRDEIVGAQAFADAMRKAAHHSDVVWSGRLIGRRGRRELFDVTWRGTVKGAPWEVGIVAVYELDEQGRGRWAEMYSEEDAAVARARLEADDGLKATSEDGLSPVAHMHREVERAFNEEDWAAFEHVLREDYRWIDRRPGLVGETHTRDEFVAMLRKMREGHDLRWIQTDLEERADGRVGLARVVQSGTYRGGPYEIPFVAINVTDEDGRSYFAEEFAEDDPAARARLDEIATHHAICRREQEAINRGDFDALRELVAEDFRRDDLRPLGGDPLTSREEYIEMLRSVRGSGPDVRLRIDVVEVAGDHRVTCRHWRGRSREGGPWEMEVWTVNTIADGRSRRAELHATREAALRRLAELAGDGEPRPADEHPLCALAAAHEAAVAAGDRDALGALLAEDHVFVSHQSGKREETHGREAAVAARLEATVAPGVTGVRQEIEVLETRGDRHGITRARWAGEFRGGPFEFTFLAVVELDADGRIRREDVFDAADLERARALLEERHASSSPGARAFALVERGFNEADWASLEAGLREDYRWVDRRPGLRATLENREQFMAMMRRIRDGTDLRWRQTWLEERAGGQVDMARIVQTGSYRGGPYEIPFLAINVFDDEGRARLGEIFAEHDPAARARLEELALHHELSAGLRDAFNDRAFDAMRPLLAEDFRQDDRRSLGADPVTSREDYLAMQAALLDAAPDLFLQMDVMAVEGARRLARQRWTGHSRETGGPLEVELWSVTTVVGGRNARSELFATGEEARAAFAGGSADLAQPDRDAAWRAVLSDFVDRWNARDWEGMAALMAPDMEDVDRRPGVALSSTGRDAILAEIRSVTDLSPDARVVLEVEAQAGLVAVATWHVTGTVEGGPFELLISYLVQGDDTLRIRRSEAFATSDESLARFRELTAEECSPIARAFAVMERGFNEADWAAVRAGMREDYRWADRRPGLRTTVETREEFIAMLRGMREGTDLRWRQTSLEERAGGRVGLARIEQTGTYRGGAYEIPFLAVQALDDDGRGRLGEMFAEDDPAAWARLEELAKRTAGVPSPVARAFAVVERGFNECDWAAYETVLAEDYRFVDHRPGLRTSLSGRDAFVTMLRNVREGTDLRWRQTWCEERAGGRVGLARVEQSGTYRGGPYEIAFLVVSEVDDEGLARFGEGFAVDDQAAWSRLTELERARADRPPTRDSAAPYARMVAAFNDRDWERHGRFATADLSAEEQDDEARRLLGEGPDGQAAPLYDRMAAAFNARDWDAFGDCFDEGFTWADRRAGLRSELRGREAIVEAMRRMADGNDIGWTYAHLLRCHRVGITRMAAEGTYRGGVFETAKLDLGWSSAGDDRFLWCDTYGEDQLEEARRRFDEVQRHLEQCGNTTPTAEVVAVEGDRRVTRELADDGPRWTVGRLAGDELTDVSVFESRDDAMRSLLDDAS